MIFIAVSAAGFGTLAILGRYAFADGLDTTTILFFRFLCAAVVMAGLLVLYREPLPGGGVLVRLAGMGAIGYVGQAFCFLTALKYASSGLVALLLYLYPSIVAILSWMVFREQLDRTKILGLVLALVGTSLTVGPEGGRTAGVLLAVAAAAIYSMYIIVGTQVMQRVSAIQSSTVIFASAALMSGILMLLKGPRLPETGAGWAAIASIVLFATLLPVVCFLAGLKRIGPTNAAMISTLEPVVTVLLAWMIFGETLKPLSMFGGGLILLAVLLLVHGEVHRTRSTPVRK